MFKKIICLVFCALTIGVTTVAHAEDYDFSEMSLDELMDMYNEIKNEINVRSEYDTDLILGPGYYIVGETAPVGTYTVINPFDDYADFYVFTDMDQFSAKEGSLMYDCMSHGDTDFVILSEGMVLYVRGCSVVLKKTEVNWME